MSKEVRRVSRKQVEQSLRTSGNWAGYLVGDQVAPSRVMRFAQRVVLTTLADLETARATVERDPDSGWRVAYYEDVPDEKEPTN